MLGSNRQWSPDGDTSHTNNESTSKQKRKDRLSRLFQKTSKSYSDDMLEPPPTISRHSSLYSIRSSQQQSTSSKISSASKKGGQVLKRLTSLRSNPPRSKPGIEQLQQEVGYKRQLLDQLYAVKQQTQQDNQRLAQDLARLQQRTQGQTTATAQLNTHLASLRATPDDPNTIRIKLLDLQQNIMVLADRLLPYASSSSTHDTSQALAGFWLNLRPSIESLCPLSPKLMRLLTAKFIFDVLVQNFNLSEIPGCPSDAYGQIVLWLLDHDYQHHLQQPMAASVPSLSSSSSSDSSFTAPAQPPSQPMSDAMLFSIRLRQNIASTVLSSQQHRPDIKRQLRHVVRGHWKFLFHVLAKAYPSIYEHDAIGESDPRRHFGAHIQALVEQAVSLGFAIKGLEMDITAVDIEEGTQLLDTNFMDELNGKTSGVIQFCISPPFRLFNHYEPLVKGKVLCFTE